MTYQIPLAGDELGARQGVKSAHTGSTQVMHDADVAPRRPGPLGRPIY